MGDDMDVLNYSMQVLNEIFPDEQRESWEQQQVDEARARYESAIVDEARAIVEGRNPKPVTKEHLRVVLEWLDGARFRLNREQPEEEWGGDTPPF
jgi:hypothetical protein